MAQGLFLGLVLLFTKQPEIQTTNRLLAALLGVFVLIMGHAWLGTNRLFGVFPHAATAIATLPLLIGPLLLLYLRGLLHGERLSRQSGLHFLLFVIALLAWTPYYLQPAAVKLSLMTTRTGMPWYLIAFTGLKVLHVCGYLWFCQRLVARADRAHPEQVLIRSVRRLTVLLGVGLALAALFFVAENVDATFPISSDLWAAGVLTAFVYGLAFYAMRLPVGYRPLLAPMADPVSPKPGVSLLTPDERARFLHDLTVCMEQTEVFRDGELTLEQLAERLALTPHELSQLINQSFGVNLQEYLNGYRVQALKTAISADSSQASNILDLAFAAGFNSKSSLNRVFKKHTGMTPTQFRGGANAPDAAVDGPNGADSRPK